MQHWRLGTISIALAISVGILAVAPCGAADALTVTRRLVLSTTGNDRGDCTTSPCRTFGYVLSRVRPGDVVVVLDGTYNERVNVPDMPDGTADQPIVVRAAHGAHPVVHGVFWIGRPVYTVFKGINVEWGGTASDPWLVRLYGGHHWAWRYSEIRGSQATSAIEVDEPSGATIGSFRIDHNCVHDTAANHGVNQDHLIYVAEATAAAGVHRLIDHNILFGSPNGRAVKLGPGGSSGGPNNIVVLHNTMDDNRGPSNVQLSQDSSDNIIAGNLLSRSGSYNITGFELSGTGNRAGSNLGWASRSTVQPDAGIVDGGGNVYSDPDFDAVNSCAGYHPRNPSAQMYGAHA